MQERDEHRWLARLVGEWTTESVAVMSPGEDPLRFAGTERVRSLDGLWTICEGRSETPGGASSSLTSLGFDPARGRAIGTFIGMGMTHMWVYDGAIDLASDVLTLEADGPSFEGDGTMARYRDEMRLEGDARRTMRSSVQQPDGVWRDVMTTTYERTR